MDILLESVAFGLILGCTYYIACKLVVIYVKFKTGLSEQELDSLSDEELEERLR